jgi:DNA repair protein RecO (recombination protein O)
MSESRQKLYRTEGIVIRRIDSGETDSILTVYTSERGKLRVMAKGVRRPGSRLAGHGELLTHAAFLIARGRNLDAVTQVQTVQSFASLRQDLERIAWGCYMAELLGRLSPEGQENSSAYELLLEALEHLDQGRDPELIARAYEVHLLGIMGYRPQVFRCVACNRELEPRAQAFSSTLGGVLCPRCREEDRRAQPISLEALKVLRYIQRGGLGETERLQLGPACRQEVEDLLYTYIRNILERDVNAVGFLETLERMRMPKKKGG